MMSLLLLSKFHRLECCSLRLVTLVSGNNASARVNLSIKSFIRATASLCQNVMRGQRDVNVDLLSGILETVLIENVQVWKKISISRYKEK